MIDLSIKAQKIEIKADKEDDIDDDVIFIKEVIRVPKTTKSVTIKKETDSEPDGQKPTAEQITDENLEHSKFTFSPNKFVEHVQAIGKPSGANIFVTVDINGCKLSGLLDTGANVNMMPFVIADRLKLKQYPVKYHLNLASEEYVCTTAVKVRTTLGKYSLMIKFLLFEHPDLIIFGLDVIYKFKLRIDFTFTVEQFIIKNGRYYRLKKDTGGEVRTMMINYIGGVPEKVAKLVKRNSEVFYKITNQIGLIKTEKCHIKLSTEIPITIRPYRCTPEDHENIDKQVDDLLKKGLITPSTSPYSFPVVMVDKKNEGKKKR